MATARIGSAAQLSTSSGAPRILLFGMPHAGKTSLLGALGRAAEIQEQLLNGRLTGFSSELPELAKRLYTEGLQPATEEIVSYSVRFDPLHTAGQWFKAAGIDA